MSHNKLKTEQRRLDAHDRESNPNLMLIHEVQDKLAEDGLDDRVVRGLFDKTDGQQGTPSSWRKAREVACFFADVLFSIEKSGLFLNLLGQC